MTRILQNDVQRMIRRNPKLRRMVGVRNKSICVIRDDIRPGSTLYRPLTHSGDTGQRSRRPLFEVVLSRIGRLRTVRLPCAARGYRCRRNSAARTRSRNCSGDSVGGSEAGACFGFTTAADGVRPLFSLRPCAPRAAPAVWFRSPSPRRRPFRPGRHQGRCVGHGKARLGSRPPSFSNLQARRLPRRSGGRRPSPAGERLGAGPEMRAGISLEAPRVAGEGRLQSSGGACVLKMELHS
jgi:hypothetical protein